MSLSFIKNIFSGSIFRSIKLKIIAVNLFITLISLVIVSIFLIYMTVSDKKRNLRNEMIKVNQILDHYMSFDFDFQLRKIEEIGKNEAVAAYIETYDAKNLLVYFQEYSKFFNELSYINLEGREEVKLDMEESSLDLKNKTDDPEFVKFAGDDKSDYMISDVFFNDKIPSLRIYYKCTDEYHDVICYLNAVMPLNVLLTKIGSVKLGSKGFVFLTDGGGKVVYHINDSLISEKIKAGIIEKRLLENLSGFKPGFISGSINGYQGFFNHSKAENFNINIISYYPKGEFNNTLVKMVIFLFLIVIITLIISLLIITYLSSKISSPIVKLSGILTDLSENEFVLTKKIDVRSDDETGQLAKSFNFFINTLYDIVRSVKELTKNAVDISGELSDSVNNSTKEIGHINGSIVNIRDKIHNLDKEITNFNKLAKNISGFFEEFDKKLVDQSTEIAESSAAINQISASISNVNTSIEEKLSLIERLNDLAMNGEEEMKGLIDSIRKINESTGLIIEFISTINKISTQTNLLAMNAAIEAAHAGEYGQGFSVVAGEIRQLAEDTSLHSKDISIALKNVINHVSNSEKAYIKTADCFDDIVKGINKISISMFEVKNAMGEISTGSVQINASLANLSEGTKKTNETSHELKDDVINLSDSVEALNVTSNDAKASTESIYNSIGRILDFIKKVQSSGSSNEKNVININNIIEKFKI